MALRLWQRSGMDELIHPEPKRPRSKPTMFQELDMIHELSEHGKQRNHTHSIAAAIGQGASTAMVENPQIQMRPCSTAWQSRSS